MKYILKRYNQTNFTAGGFDLRINNRIAFKPLETVIEFVAPSKVDSRCLCLPTSNQLKTPHCVGYGVAGYCEYYHWKNNHYPIQMDGDKIYKLAKTLDGSPLSDGTWPKYGAQAAINLGLIKGIVEKIQVDKYNIQYALHEYGVVIAGFQITNEWNMVEKNSGMIIDLGTNSMKLGGHCVLLTGYDDRGVYIQNSWGTTWGINGFAIIPWHKIEIQLWSAIVINTKKPLNN